MLNILKISIVASSGKHTSYVNCTNLKTYSACRILPQSVVKNNLANAINSRIKQRSRKVRWCGVVLSLGRAMFLMRCGDRAVGRQPGPRWPATPLQPTVKVEAFQECDGFGFI